MPSRRFLLASLLPTALSASVFATSVFAAPTFATSGDSFASFLNGVRADARAAGIHPATLDRAFAGVVPNQKVLERDRHQPEFTMTWARYRALVISDKRITEGRQAVAANRSLFQRVEQRYGVGSGVIAGIWGLESSFGAGTGDYRVVEALATLAWEGRRASFFRGELMAALKILDHGDVAPGAMTGSYAGAMGQPQFMPSSYLRYAVDFEGHGRRDIWTSKPDVLGSIANYLAASGWRANDTWGQAVTAPPTVEAQGRDVKRSVSEWARAGVRPVSGRWAASPETPAGLVAPDGAGGETFLAFNNFAAIRRYNPSDYYAIAVGLIGDQVAT
jgi:membrane-bound lytic murein transglycosylase B